MEEVIRFIWSKPVGESWSFGHIELSEEDKARMLKPPDAVSHKSE